jgi:hypothetical protein
MSRHLTATVAGYAFLLAAWTAWRAATGRGVDGTQLAAAAFLEVVLIVQAAIEAVRLLGGGRAAEPATHLGYLMASVVVLPLAVTNTSRSRTRWDAAIVGVAALATAIVTLRLRVTANA